jgi:redox-sensitive bicupin YhaK (pirin superfamily)
MTGQTRGRFKRWFWRPPRPHGATSFGANRRRASRSQIAVLGPGGALAVEDARPGTRFMLMAGKPYGEAPVFNGPFVD